MAEIRGWRAVLSFPQVAIRTQIAAEQYLPMKFEHDAEFMHGEIVKRAIPDYIHGCTQGLSDFPDASLSLPDNPSQLTPAGLFNDL